jgi:hypothetical protein
LSSLCSSGMLLVGGKVRAISDINKCISIYSSQFQQNPTSDLDLTEHKNRRPSAEKVIKRFRLLNSRLEAISLVDAAEGLTIELEISENYANSEMHFGIGVDSIRYGRVCSLATFLSSMEKTLSVGKDCIIRCTTGPLQLAPGLYSLSLSAGTPANKLLDAIDEACIIEIAPPKFLASRINAYDNMGSVAVDTLWQSIPRTTNP